MFYNFNHVFAKAHIRASPLALHSAAAGARTARTGAKTRGLLRKIGGYAGKILIGCKHIAQSKTPLMTTAAACHEGAFWVK
jgi:hypothetical protein